MDWFLFDRDLLHERVKTKQDLYGFSFEAETQIKTQVYNVSSFSSSNTLHWLPSHNISW